MGKLDDDTIKAVITVSTGVAAQLLVAGNVPGAMTALAAGGMAHIVNSMVGATGDHARDRCAGLIEGAVRHAGDAAPAVVAALADPATSEDPFARDKVAKLVREAIETVHPRAVGALGALAAEYLAPPIKPVDTFFRGAAEFFGRCSLDELDALPRIAAAVGERADCAVAVDVMAYDREPADGVFDVAAWHPTPWHLRVYDPAHDQDFINDAVLTLRSREARTLVSRLKTHHLGFEPDGPGRFDLDPAVARLDRDTLNRLAGLATPLQ